MKNAPNKLPTRMESIAAEAKKAVEKYIEPPNVHEVRREKSSGLLTLLASVLLFALEALLIFAVVNQRISPVFGLLLHIVLVVLLTRLAYLLVRAPEKKFVLLLFVSVVTTGPFGAAGVFLTVLMYLWATRHSLTFEQWFISIFPKQRQTVSQRIHDDILIGRDEATQQYSVISFMDVISFGNEAQKRRALSKATSNFHPNFAPVFRKALSDPSNTIRVLAATGIGKIESGFLGRMIQLAEVKSRYSKDPLVVWALAEHYDDYAFTGLLDYDREQLNRQKALEHYNEYLQLQPDDIEARNRIGRLLIRNKQYEKACDWLRQCIASGYSSESISQWYSEALFACGRYEDLRRYRAGLPASPAAAVMNPALGEALLLWSGNKI